MNESCKYVSNNQPVSNPMNRPVRWGFLIPVIMILLGLICSVAVSGEEPDTLLPIRLFGSLCLMGAITLVSLTIGLSLFDRNQRDVFALSLAFLVGYGLFGMLVFLIGLASGLYPGVIAACICGLALIYRRNLNYLPGRFRELLIDLRHTPRGLNWLVITVAAYACLLLVVSSGAVHAWDAHAFHWTIAKYFARYHSVPFPFFDGNGGTPHLMHMLYTVFCVFGFDHQASHANWLLFPALIGLVYGFARHMSSSVAGVAISIASFILLILRPGLVTEPALDFPMLVFGLAAFICVLTPLLIKTENIIRRDPDEISYSRIWMISGILAGYAFGVKWHALVLLPIILTLYIFSWHPVFPAGSHRRLLLGWIALAAIPVTVFAVYNFIHTGNPFWHPMIPAFWNPDYWSGVADNLHVWRTHMDYLRQHMYPSPLVDPVGAVFCYLRNNVLALPGLFIAMFALFTDRPRLRAMSRWIIGSGLVVLIIHSSLVGAANRNTLLGTGILLLLIGPGWDILMRSRYRKLVFIAPLLVAAGIVYKISDGHLPIIEQYSTRSVRVLRGPYFDEQYCEAFKYPASRWMNRHLPADAKIITDARLLGNLDRDWMTIWPAAQCIIPVSPEITSDSLRRSLWNIGITHVLVDKSRLWNTTTNFPLLADHLAAWEELTMKNEWLELQYSDWQVDVFKLRHGD